MNTELDILLDKYILDEASLNERLVLEEILAKDEKIRKILNERKSALDAIRWKGNQHLRDKFEKFHNESQNGTKFKSNWLLMLAPIVILSLVGYFLFNKTQAHIEPKVEDENISLLIAEHYQPYDASFGRRDKTDELLVKAEKAYRSGDFKNSKNQLALLAAKNSDNPEVLLALGNSFYNLKQYEDAAAVFKEVLNKDIALYHDAAKWYLSLALLNSDKKEEAIDLLLQIKNDSNSDYLNESSKVLEKLIK